jgi:glycosyltransferase involved in cell wall biosynthesis
MKVLKIIHGFPPEYMAGSEVYSYHLVKELINQGMDTYVFTRVENEFEPEYKVYDELYEGIPVRRINKPKRDYLFTDKFYDVKMDQLFREYLLKISPDIVHIGHLSHLSTNIIKIVKEYDIPIVFTIHDFWMFCIKGQMINQNFEICKNPSIENCTKCSPYEVYPHMIEAAQIHMKEMIGLVDIFVSPSKTLRDFYIQQGLSAEKVVYSKYGFDLTKIKYNRKQFKNESIIRFGFMGRIVPTKGIQLLVETFNDLPDQELNIFGSIGTQKRFLETKNIHFKGPYDNNNINQVLELIDVLIVPSIWYENAPLVIQEAFLAGIPVITSDIGGMKELVDDGKDGFIFQAGSKKDLKRVITGIISEPTILNELQDSRGKVISIQEDSQKIIEIYRSLTK